MILLMAMCSIPAYAQEKQEIFDYSREDDYIIGGISVSGVRYLDVNAIVGISGLRMNQRVTIPGDAVKTAVQRLWSQGLFSDVRITIESFKIGRAHV